VHCTPYLLWLLFFLVVLIYNCFSLSSLWLLKNNEDFYNYNPLFYAADPDAGMFAIHPNRAGASDE
jgi:hypothetical protein